MPHSPDISNVTDIKELGSNHACPVFKVKFNSNGTAYTYVLKGEQRNANIGGAVAADPLQVNWVGRVMKAATGRNDAGAHPLSQLELNACCGWANIHAKSISTVLSDTRYTWVRMPFIDDLFSVEVTANRGHVDDISNVLSWLLEPTSWEELAKITAADLFSGNNDRIILIEGQFRASSFINIPNLFFKKDQGKYKPIGLDNFDPGTDVPMTDYTEGEKNSHNHRVQLLRIGKMDQNLAENYIKAVLIGLCRNIPKGFTVTVHRNGLFNKRLTFDHLPPASTSEPDNVNTYYPFIPAVQIGFSTGITDVRNYLCRKVMAPIPGNAQPGKTPQKAPKLIIDRMIEIGWASRVADYLYLYPIVNSAVTSKNALIRDVE